MTTLDAKHESEGTASREYVSNNFSVWNAFADGLIARDSAYTQFRRNEAIQSKVKILILGLIAAILLVFLILLIFSNYGYKLGLSSIASSSKAVVPEVQYVPVPDPNLSQVIQEQVIVEVPRYIPIEVPTGGDVVTNFNIFQTVTPIINGINSVVTCMKFASSEENFPLSQYCYARTDKRIGNRLAEVDVGKVDGASPPQWVSITPSEASQVGISQSVFSELAQHCRFMAPSSVAVPEAPVADLDEIVSGPSLSSGTGFSINREGYLITNEHVVRSCSNHKVFHDDKIYDAVIIAKDDDLDLAIVKTSTAITPLEMSFAVTTRTGEAVTAIGYPLFDELGVNLKVTSGIISSLDGYRGEDISFQFSAPIQPGNSGGPLVNNLNQVVGVATASLTGDDISNVGFAIKGAVVQRFLAENAIRFTTGSESSREPVSIPDIAERAERSVFLILCL